jgi:hypothetical protein
MPNAECRVLRLVVVTVVTAGVLVPGSLAAAHATGPAALRVQTFTAVAAGEATATLRARCARCSWDAAGREAVVLTLSLDGRYSQHLVLVRGQHDAEYRVALGPVAAGEHRLAVGVDAALSAPGAGAAFVSHVDVHVARGGSDEEIALAFAPILHARANTVGRFTDVPILMWYEIAATAHGRQYRYSVIFTNEDGGTATDRLMATWGRTTDIEYVYGVEVDASGGVLAEEIQAAGHKYPPFSGRHERRHPLLWVDTDNNMVADAGTTAIRYMPAAEQFDLANQSREAVMDAHPWSYQVASQEMIREGKIRDDAAPGSGAIPDPRRYAYVEACTNLVNAALTFSIHASDGRWYDADRGLPEFRIVRSGCFRGAVPLAPDAQPLPELRFRAFHRQDPPTQDAAAVTLTRVTRVFVLDRHYLPIPLPFTWMGAMRLEIDGDWQRLGPSSMGPRLP